MREAVILRLICVGESERGRERRRERVRERERELSQIKHIRWLAAKKNNLLFSLYPSLHSRWHSFGAQWRDIACQSAVDEDSG